MLKKVAGVVVEDQKKEWRKVTGSSSSASVVAKQHALMPSVWENLAKLSDERYRFASSDEMNQLIIGHVEINPKLESLMTAYQLAVARSGLLHSNGAHEVLMHEMHRVSKIPDVECLAILSALRDYAPTASKSAVHRVLRRQVEERHLER